MDVKRRDRTPFLRREDGAGKLSGPVAPGALANPLRSPEAATAKTVVARDSFERAGSNLLESKLSPRALTSAQAPQAALRLRTIDGTAARLDAALETLIGQAAALPRGDTANEVDALRDRLEQLKAEQQALKSSIAGVLAEIGQLKGEASQGDRAADSNLDDMQRTLEQLKSALGAVDVQIKQILQRIETLRSAETDESDALETMVGRLLQAAKSAASALQELRSVILSIRK